jgi:hypothetical protein
MPPQQPDRLLDLGDDGLDFGAHIRDQFVRDQLWGTGVQAPYIVLYLRQINREPQALA